MTGGGDARRGGDRPGTGLDRLAAELRSAVGDELREDAEAAEREAALAAARSRDLVDVLRERAAAGTWFEAVVDGRRFVGSLGSVGRDLVELRTGGAPVYLAPEAAAWRTVADPARPSSEARPARSPSAAGRTSVGGMRGLLLSLEMARAEVSVGVAGEDLAGAVTAVGRDHLLLRTPGGAEAAVPLEAIRFVVVRGR